LAAACCVGLAGAAQAGPLVQLTWTQNLQGIAIEITGIDTGSDGVTDIGSGSCIDVEPDHVQTSLTCPGGLIGASGHSIDGSSYNVSLTLPLFSLDTFTTGGVVNLNTAATLMGSAAIVGGVSAAAANQGIGGMLTIRIALHVAKGADASMLAAGKTTLLKLPLGLDVGGSGSELGYFTVSGIAHYLTVDFYGWTPHTRVFTGLTSKYAALPTPTVVAMGSVGLTYAGGGTVTLVAPSKISIDGPLTQRRTASFTSLRMTYLRSGPVPEPSALLLLAAGAAGLACLRRLA
jgi:hypothetical protein